MHQQTTPSPDGKTVTEPPDLQPVTLDVRPDLAAGHEPFVAIMQAVDGLRDGQALVLLTPFDPKPLHTVLARRGFDRATRKRASDCFETMYWQVGTTTTPTSVADDGERPPIAEILDVRGLLPPEPLERTLAALERLPEGAALVQVNERVPVFLLPELDERGYTYRLAHDERGVVVTIWRGSGS